MKKLTGFVSEHLADDVTRLILDKAKWPDIDMDLAVSCIESRRKLKGKVQEWYENPDLYFPAKLSAEQCSSSATALYKAALTERIALSGGCMAGKWRIADLTGGLGVDSWFFSKKADAVLYNEMQTPLCEAAEHNFKVLGASDISISNHAVSKDGSDGFELSPSALLSDFRPDIVYMDPARRGEGGRKVFLIEECTPDVLTLKDEIFSLSRHILIKLSPMADISMVCNRLGCRCREVHVVAAGGECKELLIWMDREWKGQEYEVIAAEIYGDGSVSEFRFTPSQEKASIVHIAMPVGQCFPPAPSQQAGPLPGGGKMPVPAICPTGIYLFEPGKALMKAGAFNTISDRFNLMKLGVSTHYYMTDDLQKAEQLKQFGKVFRIMSIQSLDKRSIKGAGQMWPKAEVTARNIPMDTDMLRKKLGVTSGDDAHIFGLKSDKSGNLLIVCQRI